MVANATESLYSMINLDRVQECRPLHLTHPTPVTGRSTVAGGKVLGASVSPQDRNLWRLRAVTKLTACRYVKLQVWTKGSLSSMQLRPRSNGMPSSFRNRSTHSRRRRTDRRRSGAADGRPTAPQPSCHAPVHCLRVLVRWAAVFPMPYLTTVMVISWVYGLRSTPVRVAR